MTNNGTTVISKEKVIKKKMPKVITTGIAVMGQ